MSGQTARPGEKELATARALLSATAIRALAADRWERGRPWIDWPMLAAFVLLVAVLFASGGLRPHAVPPLDGIAGETVRAERDVLVEDRTATQQRRDQAAAQVAPIYDYDSDVYFTLGDQVIGAVRAMAMRKRDGVLDVTQRRLALQQDLGLQIKPATFELIEGLTEPNDLAVAITFFLNFGLDRMVIADRGLLPAQGGLTVHNLRQDSFRSLPDVGAITDLAQLRRLMWGRAGDAPYGEARVVRSFVLDTAAALARPNLTTNVTATEAARRAAVAQTEPVYVRIAAGEVLIREGDRVTAAVQDRIRRLNDSIGKRILWRELAAFGLLAATLAVLSGWYLRRGRASWRLTRKQAYLSLSAVAVSALICVAVAHGGAGVADGFGFRRDATQYLPPVALVGILASLLIGARTALLAGVGLAVLLTYRVEGEVLLAGYFLIGVLLGGLLARRCRRRGDLLRAGLAIGAVQALTAPLVVVLGEPGGSLVAAMLCALASGLLAAVTAIGLLPLFEHVFEETTDMRLIELASADNPLLKQLALKSPGTYYHSVMMANLAESAGDAIAANGLQCRVMALYHDIGKMLRPQYFAENQRGGNIHDRLPPELSARIIFAHIKDGIDLARRHRLGRPILDAITQHQGTTLLRVFYGRAVERARASGAAVDEAEFRYPGPRPRSRESGILMLADSVEAATRALKDPSPAELRSRVHAVVAEKLADGQLDECELTLRDLSAIEAAFVRVLTLGVYHHRIEYPPMPQPLAVDQPHEPLGHRHHDRRRGLGERAS